jgi:transporter family protein
MNNSWLFYAVAAAVSAAMVSIFGKWGMEGINSDLATALRSVVQMVCCVAFAAWLGLWAKTGQLHGRGMIMIVLSGAAGATSWLCGFKAIQMATVSQVAPIHKLSVPLAAVVAFFIFRDRPSSVNWFGIALVGVGAFLAALKR